MTDTVIAPWCPVAWTISGNEHTCWNKPGHDGEHLCLCGSVHD